jgi:hypothetical protein
MSTGSRLGSGSGRSRGVKTMRTAARERVALAMEIPRAAVSVHRFRCKVELILGE